MKIWSVEAKIKKGGVWNGLLFVNGIDIDTMNVLSLRDLSSSLDTNPLARSQGQLKLNWVRSSEYCETICLNKLKIVLNVAFGQVGEKKLKQRLIHQSV